MPEPITVDYVIVGAGSAGCVLANRLSANAGNRVLLLEAGGEDRPLRNLGQFWSNMLIHTPVGFGETLHDPKVNWLYETEEDSSTLNRKHLWPKGKVLGGSSSINGLLYVRGQHADYDGWRQMGCEGWNAEEVLPYFRRTENQERGANKWHGVGGPLSVSDLREQHPLSRAIVEACVQAGIPRSDDVNAERQEGVTWFQTTIQSGKRHSTAVAYLRPAMQRRNLQVETNAIAAKVLFEGKRAVGVEFLQNGIRRTARADKEVILAAGSVASPQILELSGIGQGALLQRHGIPVVQNLNGVGENLQDHYMIGMQWRFKQEHQSINERTHGLRLALEILRYGLTRKGVLSLPVAHVAAFIRSKPGLEEPDIQLHAMPASIDLGRLAQEQAFRPEKQPGMTITPCQLRPQSRGSIHIKSPDPAAYPAIRHNYLGDPADQEAAIRGLKLSRKVAAQPAIARYVESETAPGPGVQTDEQIAEYTKLAGTTLYHCVGTCRMGRDPDAVVDPQLRVHGVERLRVADASIMPTIVSGNTNAPVIMIAEKASDMILGRSAGAT
jgi:choline dehydrogenase